MSGPEATLLPPEDPWAHRLRRAWPIVAIVGLVLGYLFLKEGKSIDAGMRAALCGVGATLLVARAYAARSQPIATGVFTLVIIAWAGLVIGGTAGRDLDRLMEGKSRTWSHYHYYLGAKYFTELGYTDLYDQAIAVDGEGERRFAAIKWVRNLRTYDREPMNYGNRVRSESWSDDR